MNIRPIWDIANAGASHSAVCGVLAGVTLAILAIVMSRPIRGVSDAPAGQADSTRVNPYVLRLLIMSFFLLILAAIIWGGLAGGPSDNELRAWAETPPTCAPMPCSNASVLDTLTRQRSMVAESRLQSLTVGTGAVILMDLGALALLGGLIALLPGAANSQQKSLRYFSHRVVALLSLVALNQAIFFVWLSMRYEHHRLPGETPVQAILTLMFALILVPHFRNRPRLLRARQSVVSALKRASRTKKVDQALTRYAAASAALVVGVYAIGPTPSEVSPLRPSHVLDQVCVAGNVVALLVAMIFMVLLVFSVADIKP